jgi:hypothetical protein
MLFETLLSTDKRKKKHNSEDNILRSLIIYILIFKLLLLFNVKHLISNIVCFKEHLELNHKISRIVMLIYSTYLATSFFLFASTVIPAVFINMSFKTFNCNNYSA